jgi:hypothetical protein
MTAAIPPDRLREFIANTSTLGRMGEQHELDAAVVFLASPASSLHRRRHASRRRRHVRTLTGGGNTMPVVTDR